MLCPSHKRITMKLSKYLQEESRKINEKILNDEPEKYKQEIAHHFENQNCEIAIRKRTNQYMVAICAILIVILVTSILLWVFLPQRNKIYYSENENLIDIAQNEVPTTILGCINTENYSIVSAQKSIDGLSNDILYYKLKIQQTTGVIIGDIYFVTNKDYNFSFDSTQPISSCKWSGYVVEYYYENIDVNDLPMVVVSGGLVIDENTKVYFTYNDLDVDQEVAPIDFLESALIIQ